jgi:hypothetical protein
MSSCPGIKRDGTRCTVTVEPPKTHCWWHDPAYAEQRKRAASKGGKRAGRGRPVSELSEIKALLVTLTEEVLDLKRSSGVAAIANQLINTRLRAIEVERKIRETDELEERIESLERTSGSSAGGGRRWGA